MNDILAIALLISSALPFYNVHSQIALFVVSSLLTIGICLVGHIRNCERKAILFLGAATLAALWVVWLVFQIRLVAIGAQLMAASVALHSIAMCNKPIDNSPNGRPPIPNAKFFKTAPRNRIARFVASMILFALIEAVAVYGMAVFLDADIATSTWTKNEPVATNACESVEENGATKYGNVDFGSAFSNGVLDIYIAPNANEKTPTLIYVGDEANAFGSGAFGQPSINENGIPSAYLNRFIAAGYNVVSFEHASQPQYRYPTPVLQLCEAMDFLKSNASKWNLNMANVSFAGAGTGGNIAGMYVIAQTNQDYASETNIPKVFNQGEIRCIAFNSAVFDNARMGDTQSILADFYGDLFIRSYFNSNDISDNAQVAQSNLIEHVTSSMVPCYIADGTERTFDDQAKEFTDKLVELGVAHEYHVYGGMSRNFENGESEAANDCLNRQILFMSHYTS